MVRTEETTMITDADFETLKAAVQTLTTRLEDQDTRNKVLEADSHRHGAELSLLQQSLVELGENVKSKLDSEAEVLRAEIESLRGELAQALTDLTNVKSTADKAVSKADAAQSTASNALASAIKDIKFFTQDASVDTTHVVSTTTITFPERVDAVALQSIMNDGHDMWIAFITRVNDRSFKVNFRSARGEGNRWIPSVRFLGIQVQR